MVLLDWLVVFVGRSRQRAHKHTPEARRIRASKLAHKQGGSTKAAGALISLAVASPDYKTLVALRSKHSTEGPTAIATVKSWAE